MSYSHRPPHASTHEDILTPELTLSIERILNLGHGQAMDPLEKLTNDFTPVSVLNEYFPDGKYSPTPLRRKLMSSQRHL